MISMIACMSIRDQIWRLTDQRLKNRVCSNQMLWKYADIFSKEAHSLESQ